MVTETASIARWLAATGERLRGSIVARKLLKKGTQQDGSPH